MLNNFSGRLSFMKTPEKNSWKCMENSFIEIESPNNFYKLITNIIRRYEFMICSSKNKLQITKA